MDAEGLIAATRERLAGLIAPIDGGVGRDVSYEPNFDFLRMEVDKMQAVEGGRIDWDAIANGASTILSDESKDFRAILYYGAGRTKVAAAKGLFDGLVVLDALIETMWEPMYPALKRPRARGNMCAWFGDIAAPAVDALQPSVADRPFCLALDKTFTSIDGALTEKLGDAYSGMGALREAVRRLGQRLPAEPPPPAPAAAVEAPPPPTSTRTSAPQSSGPTETAAAPQSAAAPSSGDGGGGGGGYSPADITDEGSAYRVLNEVTALLLRAAEVFRESDPSSPDALRLARVATTLFVNGPLQADGNGETQINPPEDDLVNATANLFAGSDWQNLANVAEIATIAVPVWLDAYYFAATAYENQGEDKANARRVVESEALAMVRRSPGIEALRFRGGYPFASEAATEWLAGLGSAGGGGGAGAGGGARASSSEKDAGLDKVVAQARELIQQGQAPQGLALVEKAVRSAATAVGRFRAKLQAAELCLVAGFPDLARAQLDGLERVSDAHNLEGWDPDLAVQLYTMLYRSQAALGYLQTDVPEHRARVASSWQRLCQLDSSAALRTLLELG